MPTDQIIPTAVLESYLKRYDSNETSKIHTTYATFSAEQLEKAKDGPCVFIIGPHGVGKTNLAKRNNDGFASSDADTIIPLLPDFKEDSLNAKMHSQLHYGFAQSSYIANEHDATWQAINACTNKFRPAARWCADMLLMNCVLLGKAVMFEASGKNKDIATLIENVAGIGMETEVNLCLAPLEVLEAASTKHYIELHDFAINPKDIRAEHDAVIANAKTIAAAAPETFSLHWRVKPQSPLVEIVLANKGEYKILDDAMAQSFDHYMSANGYDLSIASLMGDRQKIGFVLSQTLKVEPAPAF